MNFKLLKNKDFMNLTFGQFVSITGTEMQNFALALYVLNTTGSAKRFASVLAVSAAVRLILSPICGVLSDWFDKKKIVFILDMISGILTLVLYFISITKGLSIRDVYVVVILLSIITSLYKPAISSIIPLIIEKDKLREAISIDSFSTSIASLFAPLISSFLYTTFGISVIIIVNSVSFIFSSITKLFISISPINNIDEKKTMLLFKSDLKEGLRFIIKSKIIRTVLISVLFINFILNPAFSIACPYAAKVTLKISDIQFGILQTVQVLGMIFGSIASGFIGKKTNEEKIFYTTMIVLCGIMGMFSIILSDMFMKFVNNENTLFVIFCIIGALMSVLISIMKISLNTIRQNETPKQLLGRVNSLTSTGAMATIPLGQIVFGMLLDIVPSSTTFIVTAISLLLVAIYVKKEFCISYLKIPGIIKK